MQGEGRTELIPGLVTATRDTAIADDRAGMVAVLRGTGKPAAVRRIFAAIRMARRPRGTTTAH